MEATQGGARAWAIATVAAGLVALATTVAFRMLPDVTAAGACMPADAVVKFEFARTAGDIDAIFGPAGGACRAKVIAGMDATNTLDTRLYIPSYTAFVIFAAMFLGHGRLRLPVVVATAAGLGALAADYVETFSLLAYTPDLRPTPDALATSSTAAWTKFWLLGAASLGWAWICFTVTKRRWILGAIEIAPIVGVAAAFFVPSQLGLLTLGFIIGWISLLAMALRASVMGRETKTPAR